MFQYSSRLFLAAIATSLSYYLGDLAMSQQLSLIESVIIGFSVVLVGAFVEKIKSPMWLIIAVPFPIGMGLLYSFLQTTFGTWIITYMIILLIYFILHMLFSKLFAFHSLIPAWKLSENKQVE